MQRIKIHFDGACANAKNKDCPMGIGVAVFVGGVYQEELSRAALVEDEIEDGTSNIAEWMALCLALEVAGDLRKTHLDAKIIIVGDSQLIANQFNMIWSIKEDKFLKYFSKARKLNEIAKVPEIQWVPRKFNTKADELSKMGLNSNESRKYEIRAMRDELSHKWIEYRSDHFTKVQRIYDALITGIGESHQVWDTELNQIIKM
jgi:ribonuclease HI